jgi:WD40 repeat protein
VAFSPDGKYLATAGDDQTVRLWDVTSGAEVRRMSGHKQRAFHVAFHPDGHLLASAGGDGAVQLWDVATGRVRRTLLHEGGVYRVAFSPNGWLASSSFQQHPERGTVQGVIRLWDPDSGKKLLTLAGHTDMISSLAFSRDGKRLASGSSDRTIKLWDPRSGQETLTLRGHEGRVANVAFSPDGHRLFSADTTIPNSRFATALHRVQVRYSVRVWDATPLPDPAGQAPQPGSR